jgi:hypothetical protein
MLLTEKLVEIELMNRMKRSQEGWIDPEDDAQHDWTNPNPEL